MPSQSTERKISWDPQTRLVCNRFCALVNSFLNRAIVTTSPGLSYLHKMVFFFIDIHAKKHLTANKLFFLYWK